MSENNEEQEDEGIFPLISCRFAASILDELIRRVSLRDAVAFLLL